MRIAHLAPGFLPVIGGAEIAVHNLALEQHRAGHDVTVITRYHSWRTLASALPYRVLPMVPKAVGIAIRLFRMGVEGRWFVWLNLAAYQWLLRFDMWHVHMAYMPGYLAVSGLKRMGQPVVLTCQGIDIQCLPEIGYGHRLDTAKDRVIRAALQMCDRVGAISASVRDDLLDAGVAPDQIINIPNGADVERIQAVKVERQAERLRRGWPADRVVLTTVGRNHPKKGFDLIPDIIRTVAQRRGDFLWVIIGKGCEPVADRARALGVGDYLLVIPQIGIPSKGQRPGHFELPNTHLIRLLKAADVFVFPTLMEGMPLAVVEAMAAGLPIATTDAAGVRDVVEHERTGLISPAKDVGGMARNVERLVSDRSLRRRLGENALREAARYRWGDVAQAYIEVYREVLIEKPEAVRAPA